MSSEAGVPELVVATVVAKNHMPRARVLAASLRRVHPELALVVLLMDEPEGRFDPEREPFEVLRLADVRETDLRVVAFRYAIRAAAGAAKPSVLRHLLGRGHRHVLYLDADMFVAGDLTPVLEAVRGASIVLTPHLLAAATGVHAHARELLMVRAGVLNTGLVGVSADPAGERFVSWWESRLSTHCVADLANGLHFDQRWADLATGLFGGVHLLRDPGVNVAYWNLAERPLRIAGDRVTAAGRPCRLLHFSGYDVRRPEHLSLYAPDLWMVDLGDVIRLAERYRRELLEAGESEALGWPWAFDRWADGTPIDPAARAAHRALGPESAAFGDPFAAGPDSFRDWFSAQSTT